MLAPLLLAQFLVFRDLDERRAAAADARVLVDRIGLTTAIGSIYAPAAFEESASLGLAFIDSIGVDRSIATLAMRFDYEPYLLDARAQLDRVLDSLEQRYGRLVLGGGLTVSQRLGDLRAELAGHRALLD